MIEMTGISKAFDGNKVLNNVEFTVKKVKSTHLWVKMVQGNRR